VKSARVVLSKDSFVTRSGPMERPSAGSLGGHRTSILHALLCMAGACVWSLGYAEIVGEPGPPRDEVSNMGDSLKEVRATGFDALTSIRGVTCF